MNIYSSLFFALIYYLLMLLGPVISETEYGIIKNNEPFTPLALIRENGKFRLAEPEKSTDENYINFPYDPSKGQEFIRACLDKDETADKILSKKTDPDPDLKCEDYIQPSYQITNVSECYDDTETKKGNQYQVGYLVRNEQTRENEHQKIYNICYSEAGSTLYAVYTIAYWDLLDINVLPFPFSFPVISTRLGIDLDQELDNNSELQLYQLVPWYDLPLNAWRFSTLFNFNSVLLSSQGNLIRLNSIDNYIREAVSDMKSPVTVYTGSFSILQGDIEPSKDKIRSNLKLEDSSNEPKKNDPTWMERSKESVISIYKYLTRDINESKVRNFIWKIIHHDTEGAIAIITFIDQSQKCVELCKDVASEAKWFFLEPSKKGPCTYVCEVDGVINSMFGLSHLGKIPKKLERKNTTPSSNNDDDDENDKLIVENSITDNSNLEGDKVV